jgi:glycolate oxidase iron-sulfur subunit
MKDPWPSAISLKPMPCRVMLHTPCTRRNVLKSIADPQKLLAMLPELKLQSFVSPLCCGAAGTYMLDHETLADPLAKALLSELDGLEVDYVATSNIGCALHFLEQLSHLKSKIRVIHPITLLAQSLGFEKEATNS